ncbi:heavy metal translocating P-type ATPase [soil metagenome]
MLKRYPVVFATVLVGAVGGVLWLAGAGTAMNWLFSLFALAVAALEALQMIRQLRRGVFGIDILAIIAIVTTVAVGEFLASMIIVLMLASGKALEDFAAGRAQRELAALLAREPQVAHRREPGGDHVQDIPVDAVAVGDTLVVRSGEVVPVDGILGSVEASLDESSLTGESMPVQLVGGDAVLSGAVNGPVAFTMTATALARDSQFQGIIALVKQAEGNRAPVVRLADRYAIPFTVVSLAIAGIAWLVSGDPVRFAEVLVLATPCPLLLAAPVAFMGGMSRAARNGIIVKGGGVLETLARVRAVVFDKTGTLTAGAPTIARVLPAGGRTADELLVLVAGAEKMSSHVLAASIVAAAEAMGLTVPSAESASETAAAGVRARVAGYDVGVGTLAFVRSLVPDVPVTETRGGELAIYVAVDGEFGGTVIASDPVRTNARETVEALGALGVAEVVMLTGDSAATAGHVARQLGINTYRSDCLAADKLDFVAGMTARPVLMVGDGVNDAPVLAAADVGIAMGARGATAASESAGAVILLDDVSLAARAIVIGRETVRIALQSIWLGVTLSLVLMVVAAFGVIPATVGAGIQEVVDLATILNALRAIRPGERGRR